MSEKPEGWYYVGGGQLRYRDGYGWTEFLMATSDPRAQDWPPPTPRTILQHVTDVEARPDLVVKKRRNQRSRWFRRGAARPN